MMCNFLNPVFRIFLLKCMKKNIVKIVVYPKLKSQQVIIAMVFSRKKN